MENNYLQQQENELKAILAVYDSEINYHPVKNGKVGAGELLTMQTAKNVFKIVNDLDEVVGNYSFKEFIKNNVLYYSEQEKEVVWVTEATKKQLLFLDTLSLQNGIYPIPVLLWKLSGDTLQVWALEKVPTKANEPLFHAPFLNINQLGSVCMGNAKFSSTSKYYENIISKAESVFYNSIFTHTNHNEIIKGNYSELLELLRGKNVFPSKLLVKTTKTIQNIIYGN